MGVSKKLSRKSSIDSDDSEEFDDMESEKFLSAVEDFDDDGEDDEDEEGEEEEDSEEEDEDEEDGDEGEEQQEVDEESGKDAEMEDLEKEYMNLRNQEQDIWKNLKRHKDEDLIKGQAVKNQKALWDKTLEFRFLLQKAFANSNRLPQEPVRSSFCDSDEVVGMAYADLITSAEKTLESLLELQEALLEKNPSISLSSNGDSGLVTKKHSKDSTNSDGEEDIDWLRISEMQKRIAPFRNKSIDKWQRKTQVTTGAAAMTGKLQAFNQNISEQVAAYMRDPTKMVRQMQQRRSAIGVFGDVPESTSNAKGEETHPDGDPELLNDSEFYQQLLKEFFENVDPSSTETTFYALKRLQTKKRKIVDRRASKSRKIRYTVHEKIVNFMAPRPMNIPPMAPKVFENLFGLKAQKPAVDS
ncbi:hypothetical protein OIU78_022963 [Salix suchowensis]|nr:apoptosis antagonizing transcription factor-domain-containing [Salix suchowensis]KAJ6297329.1 hypothetical protein OIU78_022963 [Salix suchowensis]KAJ6297331.1 hypothetical protein OIU78_022963 [Salix suchowensis]